MNPFKKLSKSEDVKNSDEKLSIKDLSKEDKQKIALEYLVSPAPIRLQKKEKKKSDQVWIITRELNIKKLYYKNYPDGFTFREKYYPILPVGIIPLKTKWRKKTTGSRIYIQPEDMLGPAYPNGQEVLTDIPWIDPETGEPIKEKIQAIIDGTEKGEELKKELESVKVKTSQEVLDWLQAKINELYTEGTYGRQKSKQGAIITALLMIVMLTGTLAVVFGILAAHAGVL